MEDVAGAAKLEDVAGAAKLEDVAGAAKLEDVAGAQEVHGEPKSCVQRHYLENVLPSSQIIFFCHLAIMRFTFS